MRWGLLGMGLLVAGCNIGGDNCPEPNPLNFLKSGTYASPGGAPIDWHCTQGCSVVFPPHEGVADLELELKIEEDVAIIRYIRDGKQIVERWAITGRTQN